MSTNSVEGNTKVSENTPVHTSELWADQLDNLEEKSTSSEDEESILEELKKLSKKFKRKAIESPENNTVNTFEKVLSKKQRKKLKKSSEKQKL